MNDYLGNLVARTLGQMPAVEPRLASRFEQVEPLSRLKAFHPRDSEPVEIEEESSEELPNQDRAVRSERRAVRVDRGAEPDGSLERDNNDGKFFQGLSDSGPTAIKTTQPPPSAEQVLPSPQPERILASPVDLQPNRLLMPEIQPNLAVESSGNFDDLALRGRNNMNQSEAQRTDLSQQADGEAERKRDREKSDGQPPQSVSRLEPHPPVEWLLQAASVPPVSAPIPAIERKPVIKVTIGRVEVRAVMNAPAALPAPAVEQSPRIQSLTLGEYLRRRNNGEL